MIVTRWIDSGPHPGAASCDHLRGRVAFEFDEQRVVPIPLAESSGLGNGVDGALRLVTSMRRNGTSDIDVESAARVIEPGLLIVPGAEVGEQARPVWADSAIDIARRLTVDDRIWLVDIGRTDETNPSIAFAQHSKLTVVVVSGRPEDLVQLPTRVASLLRNGGRVGVIVSTLRVCRSGSTSLLWC